MPTEKNMRQIRAAEKLIRSKGISYSGEGTVVKAEYKLVGKSGTVYDKGSYENTSSFTAVSYTHLDVYKRQVIFCHIFYNKKV